MNAFSRPPACPRCHDIRKLTKHVTARLADLVPCPACGNFNAEEYDRFRREAWARDQAPPSICELDLSREELETLRRWRRENPTASKLTVLSWIEGQRYEPAKNPEFMADVEVRLKAWRAERDARYDDFRNSHPYSKGDGRIGHERDSHGVLFQAKSDENPPEGARTPVQARSGARPATISPGVAAQVSGEILEGRNGQGDEKGAKMATKIPYSGICPESGISTPERHDNPALAGEPEGAATEPPRPTRSLSPGVIPAGMIVPGQRIRIRAVGVIVPGDEYDVSAQEIEDEDACPL
jgi:hypothetical protein